MGTAMRHIKIIMICCLLVLLSGCLFRSRVRSKLNYAWYGPPYKVTNYYRHPELYSMGISRVAVLPFINESQYSEAAEKVHQAFVGELKKTNSFAVVVDETDQAADLLDTLRRHGTIDPSAAMRVALSLNVDGLIICRITNYFPYRPPVLGLDVFLVHPQSQEVVWQVDELFDSSNLAVMNAIRVYYDSNFNVKASDYGYDLFVYSISRYSQFVTHEIVATLKPEPVQEEEEIAPEEEIAQEAIVK